MKKDKHRYFKLDKYAREDLFWRYEDYIKRGGALNLLEWFNRHIHNYVK